MYRSGQQLRNPVDFDNAIFFALKIEIYQEDKPIDKGGHIQKHTDESVMIDGSYFFKINCDFRVR